MRRDTAFDLSRQPTSGEVSAMIVRCLEHVGYNSSFFFSGIWAAALGPELGQTRSLKGIGLPGTLGTGLPRSGSARVGRIAALYLGVTRVPVQIPSLKRALSSAAALQPAKSLAGSSITRGCSRWCHVWRPGREAVLKCGRLRGLPRLPTPLARLSGWGPQNCRVRSLRRDGRVCDRWENYDGLAGYRRFEGGSLVNIKVHKKDQIRESHRSCI